MHILRFGLRLQNEKKNIYTYVGGGGVVVVVVERQGMKVAITHYMSKPKYASNYNQTIFSTHKSEPKYYIYIFIKSNKTLEENCWPPLKDEKVKY